MCCPPLRLLCVACLFAGCFWAPANSRAAEPTASSQLERLLDEHWEWTLAADPLEASYLGDKRYNALWPDVSEAAIQARHEQRGKFVTQLQQIAPLDLTPSERVNRQLLLRDLQLQIEAHPFGWHCVPLDQRGGIQTVFEVADALSFLTEQDYLDWISRLNSFDRYMDQTIALMQQGVDRGIVQTQVVMRRLPAQIRRLIVDDPEKSLLYKPFFQFPEAIPADRQAELRQLARTAIEHKVVPAYRKLLTFFEEIYFPACFEQVGISQIPNGKEFYAHRARLYTTTDLTPAEIHQIGLEEVARIRGEMEAIIREVEFKGSFREFLEFLRTDPQFYYTNENDLFAAVQATCKKIDPQLVKLFKKLPRMPYGVEPIPAAMAPDTTTAYYRPPAADGSRAGSYFYNLYRPDQRPKYELEVLSLHEAVPGHHLQIALAMELDELPPFRRYGGYTAFVEGWGLYSERLGSELGLYQDPYSRFGMLTYDMWRAIRLVVDTGMHTFGWSRDQAIAMFLENTAKTRLDIENEVDRYISWPGQALAYKIGQLKILELRARAEQQLGDRFDIREFHEKVLENGAVTLDVLEIHINDWLQSLADSPADR